MCLPSTLVVQLAQAVADSDPRFDKVVVTELNESRLEISVLTPECEVTSVDEIEVGRHGLIVEHGSSAVCCCPRCRSNRGWDRDTFLDHTCLKAGCLPGAWGGGARISASKRSSSANAAAPRGGSSRMDNVCHTLVGAAFGEPA